jgi:uncharacterized protein
MKVNGQLGKSADNLGMRMVWNLVGLLFVGIGTAGIFVPGLPATVFFILALYSFTKGANEKWRQRLLNHKVVGSTLRHWEEHRSISRRIKWVSSICIAVSCGLSSIVIPPVWVKVLVLALGAFGIWYVLSRKTTEDIVIEEPVGEFEGLVA